MKRWGMVLLVMAGFISGIIYVYACGGGGSGAMAAIEAHFHDPVDISPQGTGSGLDADYLDGMEASSFALSSHSHNSSSSTQYYSVSSTFHGFIHQMEFLMVSDEEHFANADTSVWWVGLSPSGIDSTSRGVVYMPVDLPTGAMITEFGIVYYDERVDSWPVKAKLRRTPEYEKINNIANIESTETDFIPQYAWTTSIDPLAATVDNSTYSYYIRAQLQGGVDLAIISGMVGYKLP